MGASRAHPIKTETSVHEGELTRKTALARSDLDDDEQARSAATPLRSISLLHLAVDEDLRSYADLTRVLLPTCIVTSI